MSSYLFVNPSSGHYSVRQLQNVLKRLSSCAVNPKVFQVYTPAEIFTCCSEINKENGPHLVIVAGGDGTFNAVVNGLEPGTATLAVLPFGTSNVLAAEIGITSIDDALDRITVGKTSGLSLGVLELEGRSHRFVLMAGIGLDGTVVKNVGPSGKKFLRQGAYALSALKSTMAWDNTFFDISTSQGNVRCNSAIICNASRYGGNFILSPGSSPFTAGLTAVCITDNRRRTYIRIASDLFCGMKQPGGDLVMVPASDIEISGTRAIQIDGDFIGYGPAKISTEPDFARIIV